jgi:hypothetical protein
MIDRESRFWSFFALIIKKYQNKKWHQIGIFVGRIYYDFFSKNDENRLSAKNWYLFDEKIEGFLN